VLVFATLSRAITVKLFALVAAPPGVVTLIGPEVAAAGTVARIEVAEVTVKLAVTPLKLTLLAPPKLVPLIRTLVPTAPLVGAKLVTVGGPGNTVKSVGLLAAPPGVVTVIRPVVAAAGTVAWIVVDEVTVKLAFAPLKVTLLAPSKFVPLIWTLVPTGPLVGAKFVTVGGGTVTVKALALVAVPAGVVTTIGPVRAPEGTDA
jgi:hypothetical protein